MNDEIVLQALKDNKEENHSSQSVAIAILLMDMPDSCKKCDLVEWDLNDQFCVRTEKPISIYGGRPDWCPLKSVPKEYEDLVRSFK